MPALVRISIKEATELADSIEDNGGNALSLRSAVSELTKKKVGLQIIAANEISDEEHVEELRQKSTIEHGEALECMVCHEKFNTLVSGTCENCFREWALTTKRR